MPHQRDCQERLGKALLKQVASRRPSSTIVRGNHRAGLNFGDCLAYSLAKVSEEPLLFKGNDFRPTDVKAVF
jgi:uncharacterized protein with PIN domain